MSELKPCPICGATLRIYSPEDWKPSCCNPHRSGDPYSADCDCGFRYSNGSYDYAEFVAALDRRAQPANSRFADCHIWEPGDKLDTLSDKCDVLIKAADIKALMRPSDEPLTLDELRGMAGEPIYIVEIGLERNNRWEIIDRECPVDADLEDVNLCNGDCYATYNMGIAWLAYRRKPEGSESDA